MFWRFGGYANISTIDTILDKPDFALEELLDESDLIQELKQHNAKLIDYLRDETILQKLLDYVVAPRLEAVETPSEPVDDDVKGKGRLLPFARPRAPSRAADAPEADEEEQEKRRNRYALVACEILSSETWSICEALTENLDLIRSFWVFLGRPAPLDPLQASYFTKVNESLFERKTEEMMALFRGLPNIVPDLLRHVECPMVMDLLLKVIALDRAEGGQGIVEWLYSKDIIPLLLSCLDPSHSWVVQTAAGDFIKAIITISANASQNEQQCIGPNELTRQLVSRPCVEQLVGYMLGGGNPLTVGVGIIIEVIRKNNSDYDPDVGSEANTTPSSRDPIYLGILLRLFAENVPHFMSLIMDGPLKKPGLASTFGEHLELLGFDRFKTCELMAELLHCSNMSLLNEGGSEQVIAARDAERDRLRIDGKLGPQRDEDHSADDLTMRIPQATNDESRRLEVTNADDDGFEELEPNKEMGEDEYVKADDDDDEPTPPPTSFLGRDDDDDFVDEPLNSPQPSFSNNRADDADLVVAPLSPSKVRAKEGGEPAASSPSAAPTDSALHQPKSESVDSGTERELESKEPEDVDVAMEDVPPSESRQDDTVSTERDGSDANREFSPHPEDTPAPLFSASGAADVSQQQSEANETPEAAPESQRSPHAENAGEHTEETASTLPATESREDAGNIEPVVGDYLKMQFVDHNVVPTILSFFFAYPWNNFLHNVVYDVVQQVFNGPMDRGYNTTLAVSLFESADITTAIIKGQEASDASQAQAKTRMGYMGHLTLIAEEVVKFTERHPPELLSDLVLEKVMSQDWINYVEGPLAETRERDNAILGGVRLEVALSHRASISGNGLAGAGLSALGGGSGPPSNALAEAGLNGGIELAEGAGSGIGPFAISAGTLLSGFGSSSDEEEEEGEGDDEDINSEFRAYTDPLNNTGNPMAPPSIPPPPPPPPPLNVPPSRARLQLAARLAMHQKNNQTSTEEEAEGDDGGGDPFGDGEELDDELSGNVAAEAGRGSWWRGMVKGRGKLQDGDSDDADDDDDDEEFGDFSMAETEGAKQGESSHHVLLRPLAVHPAKESSRGLSGLWPFGTRGDKDKNKNEGDGESLTTARDAAATSAATTAAAAAAASATGEKSNDQGPAVEVKEARSRTSIEEPDDEEVIIGVKEPSGNHFD